MAYTRDESFLGHVHRHPAHMEYEHVADADGRLVAVRLRLVLDGGAYASSSPAVVANAATLGCGPYAVPNARIEATVAYTNNPPSGAMRGFGSVQVAIGYEAQMDRLAARSGWTRSSCAGATRCPRAGSCPPARRSADRCRSRSCSTGSPRCRCPSAPPIRSRFRAARSGRPTARPSCARSATPRASRTSRSPRGTTTPRPRGCAWSAGTAACPPPFAPPPRRSGRACSACRSRSRARSSGIEDVRVEVADTGIASAGSASASRLTWIVGGAVREACRAVAAEVADLPEGSILEAERTYRHGPTKPMDPVTGQGDSHAGFAFVAHRAVVDVDELRARPRARRRARVRAGRRPGGARCPTPRPARTDRRARAQPLSRARRPSARSRPAGSTCRSLPALPRPRPGRRPTRSRSAGVQDVQLSVTIEQQLVHTPTVRRSPP